MDTWLQDNASWVVPLLTIILSSALGGAAWSQADRAKKKAEAAKTQAEAVGAVAGAAKTQAEASKTSADALMGEIQAAQAGFTFVDTRLKWMEGQMTALQSQVADGFALNLQIQKELREARARIQKLEQELEDTRSQLSEWQSSSRAWEHYAIALESSIRIAPAPVQKQIDSRLEQLHGHRPEPIEHDKERH